uniref:Uncharacterized protein LOC100378304 isoform X1 n=1 Tax=Saccoglossus kowalevskii TaxID=10224 RepID=A0ABM0GKA7_SACKO|nr:PREDICTED: uncharacterized protein LOC100378304 isoform X1 [Saccoglossus kowalevskii]
MPRSTASSDMKYENRSQLVDSVSSLPAIAAPCSVKSLSTVSHSAPVNPSGATPYRLPRITPKVNMSAISRLTKQEELYKIDDDDDGRSSAIIHYIHKKKMFIPPHTISQLQRANSLMVPSFRKAHLAPMTPAPSVASDRTYNRVNRLLHVPKLRIGTGSVHSFQQNLDEEIFRRKKKVAWKLSPHTNSSFDKASCGYSGPFSREFTIHCTAPNSWLRKKWKGQSTTLR